MKNCVLCYLEKDGKYLMLNRNKKKNDIASKWPLIAAKAYTFENHFKEAKRIYFTAKENPIWLGIIVTSVLENNYKNKYKLVC